MDPSPNLRRQQQLCHSRNVPLLTYSVHKRLNEPQSKPDESNSHPHGIYFHDHSNIILLYTLTSS
jgi:hypothetical protein